MNHLDDDAELYALGLTERERDAEIEAHLAACDRCRARVVAAEAAAAALASALPPMPAAAPRRIGAAWWTPLATAAAAAFAIATAAEAYTAHVTAARLAQTDVALTAIAASHFGHTTLASDPGVVAKALYARDGSWCYIVASGAPNGAHVVLRHGPRAVDAGALTPGSPATLFVRAPGKTDGVAVIADGRAIAHGTPAY